MSAATVHLIGMLALPLLLALAVLAMLELFCRISARAARARGSSDARAAGPAHSEVQVGTRRVCFRQ
jgi:hypothetical protein